LWAIYVKASLFKVSQRFLLLKFFLMYLTSLKYNKLKKSFTTKCYKHLQLQNRKLNLFENIMLFTLLLKVLFKRFKVFNRYFKKKKPKHA
jgi:hypothetical protein